MVRIHVATASVSMGQDIGNQGRGSSTHMYFILLLRLGCILSGCHLKIYITNAQLRLAKTGQEFACILARTSGESNCVGNDIGKVESDDGACTESLANANTTRAKTKMTI